MLTNIEPSRSIIRIAINNNIDIHINGTSIFLRIYERMYSHVFEIDDIYFNIDITNFKLI